MGRPTKCTEERTGRVCEALRKGVSIKSAMELAALDESTYYKWRKKGQQELERVSQDGRRSVRKAKRPYVQFFKATTRAIAESEEWLVDRVREAAVKDGRTALDMLSRRFSDRWSKKEIREMQGKGGGPVQVIFEQRETDE